MEMVRTNQYDALAVGSEGDRMVVPVRGRCQMRAAL